MITLFDPDARTEFLEAVLFYENAHAGLGRRFRQAVDDGIKKLASSPERYRVLTRIFHESGALICKASELQMSWFTSKL